MPLKISYFQGPATFSIAMPGREIGSESLAISGTSAQSGATPDAAQIVLITATENAYIRYGSNPTATTGTDQYISAGNERWFEAKPGWKIAGIQ